MSVWRFEDSRSQRFVWKDVKTRRYQRQMMLQLSGCASPWSLDPFSKILLRPSSCLTFFVSYLFKRTPKLVIYYQIQQWVRELPLKSNARTHRVINLISSIQGGTQLQRTPSSKGERYRSIQASPSNYKVRDPEVASTLGQTRTSHVVASRECLR